MEEQCFPRAEGLEVVKWVERRLAMFRIVSITENIVKIGLLSRVKFPIARLGNNGLSLPGVLGEFRLRR